MNASALRRSRLAARQKVGGRASASTCWDCSACRAGCCEKSLKCSSSRRYAEVQVRVRIARLRQSLKASRRGRNPHPRMTGGCMFEARCVVTLLQACSVFAAGMTRGWDVTHINGDVSVPPVHPAWSQPRPMHWTPEHDGQRAGASATLEAIRQTPAPSALIRGGIRPGRWTRSARTLADLQRSGASISRRAHRGKSAKGAVRVLRRDNKSSLWTALGRSKASEPASATAETVRGMCMRPVEEVTAPENVTPLRSGGGRLSGTVPALPLAHALDCDDRIEPAA